VKRRKNESDFGQNARRAQKKEVRKHDDGAQIKKWSNHGGFWVENDRGVNRGGSEGKEKDKGEERFRKGH